jgi:hypothetical protein
MPTIADIRKQWGGDADRFSDYEIAHIVAQHNGVPINLAYKELGLEQPNTPGFGTGLASGLASNVGGIGQVASDIGFGDNALQRYAKDVQIRNPTPDIEDWEHFKQNPLGGLAQFAGSAVGSTAPSLALGGVGGVAGRMALARAAAGETAGLGLRATAGLNSMGVQTAVAGLPAVQQIADEQVKSAMSDNGPVDMLARYGASWLIGKTEMGFGAQRLLGIGRGAEGFATKAALTPGRAAAGEAVEEFGKSPLRTFGKSIPRTAIEEGIEEGIQQPIQQLASYQDPTTEASLRDTGWNIFGGVVGGAALGPMGGAVQGLRHSSINNYVQENLANWDKNVAPQVKAADYKAALIEREHGPEAANAWHNDFMQTVSAARDQFITDTQRAAIETAQLDGSGGRPTNLLAGLQEMATDNMNAVDYGFPNFDALQQHLAQQEAAKQAQVKQEAYLNDLTQRGYEPNDFHPAHRISKNVSPTPAQTEHINHFIQNHGADQASIAKATIVRDLRIAAQQQAVTAAAQQAQQVNTEQAQNEQQIKQIINNQAQQYQQAQTLFEKKIQDSIAGDKAKTAQLNEISKTSPTPLEIPENKLTDEHYGTIEKLMRVGKKFEEAKRTVLTSIKTAEAEAKAKAAAEGKAAKATKTKTETTTTTTQGAANGTSSEDVHTGDQQTAQGVNEAATSAEGVSPQVKIRPDKSKGKNALVNIQYNAPNWAKPALAKVAKYIEENPGKAASAIGRHLRIIGPIIRNSTSPEEAAPKLAAAVENIAQRSDEGSQAITKIYGILHDLLFPGSEQTLANTLKARAEKLQQDQSIKEQASGATIPEDRLAQLRAETQRRLGVTEEERKKLEAQKAEEAQSEQTRVVSETADQTAQTQAAAIPEAESQTTDAQSEETRALGENVDQAAQDKITAASIEQLREENRKKTAAEIDTQGEGEDVAGSEGGETKTVGDEVKDDLRKYARQLLDRHPNATLKDFTQHAQTLIGDKASILAEKKAARANKYAEVVSKLQSHHYLTSFADAGGHLSLTDEKLPYAVIRHLAYKLNDKARNEELAKDPVIGKIFTLEQQPEFKFESRENNKNPMVRDVINRLVNALQGGNPTERDLQQTEQILNRVQEKSRKPKTKLTEEQKKALWDYGQLVILSKGSVDGELIRLYFGLSQDFTPAVDSRGNPQEERTFKEVTDLYNEGRPTSQHISEAQVKSKVSNAFKKDGVGMTPEAAREKYYSTNIEVSEDLKPELEKSVQDDNGEEGDNKSELTTGDEKDVRGYSPSNKLSKLAGEKAVFNDKGIASAEFSAKPFSPDSTGKALISTELRPKTKNYVTSLGVELGDKGLAYEHYEQAIDTLLNMLHVGEDFKNILNDKNHPMHDIVSRSGVEAKLRMGRTELENEARRDKVLAAIKAENSPEAEKARLKKQLEAAEAAIIKEEENRIEDIRNQAAKDRGKHTYSTPDDPFALQTTHPLPQKYIDHFVKAWDRALSYLKSVEENKEKEATSLTKEELIRQQAILNFKSQFANLDAKNKFNFMSMEQAHAKGEITLGELSDLIYRSFIDPNRDARSGKEIGTIPTMLRGQQVTERNFTEGIPLIERRITDEDRQKYPEHAARFAEERKQAEEARRSEAIRQLAKSDELKGMLTSKARMQYFDVMLPLITHNLGVTEQQAKDMVEKMSLGEAKKIADSNTDEREFRKVFGNISKQYLREWAAKFYGDRPPIHVASAVNDILTGTLTPKEQISKIVAAKKEEAAAKQAGYDKKAGAIYAELKKWFFFKNKVDKIVTYFNTYEDALKAHPELSRFAPTLRGAYVDGKVALIGENIEPQDALGIFLHEVGVHYGLEKMVGKETMAFLTKQIDKWGGTPLAQTRVGEDRNNLVITAARNASARAGKSNSSENRKGEETIAYFIEELVKAGYRPGEAQSTNVPSLQKEVEALVPKTGDYGDRTLGAKKYELRNWFKRLYDSVNKFLTGLGVKVNNITAQDILNLAYVSARRAVSELTTPQAGIAESQNQTPDVAASEAPAFKNPLLQGVLGDTGARLIDTTKDIFSRAVGAMTFMDRLLDKAAEIDPTTGKALMKSAIKFREARDAIQKFQGKIDNKVEEIAIKARNLIRADYDAAAAFIKKSTTAQLWGYNSNGMTADPAMAIEFKKLNAPARAIVQDIFQHGQDMLALRREILKSLGVDNLFTKGMGIGMENKPYAPLMRFGDYVAVLKSNALLSLEKVSNPSKAQLAQIELLKADPNSYMVSRFSTKGQANEFLRKTQARNKNLTFGVSFHKGSKLNQGTAVPVRVMQRILSALKVGGDQISPEAHKAAVEFIQDMYYQLHEENSARQQLARRKTIEGADKDMIRAFISHGMAEASMLANLKHGGELNDAYYKMGKEAAGEDGNKMHEGAELYDLITRHYTKDITYSTHPFQSALMGYTSTFQLASSIGYHINNLTQVVMVTVPRLAADFDNYGAAWDATWKGYELANQITKGKRLGWDGVNLEVIKDPAKRKYFQDMVDSGLANTGMTNDAQTIKGKWTTDVGAINQAGEAVSDAMDRLRRVSSTVELWNRLASGSAAYDMHYAKHKNAEAAARYMVQVVQDTQGDFSKAGAPLILKNLPPMVGQYRKYQLMMMGVYATAVHQAFFNADPTVREIGRRMLAYKLFHTFMGAGLMGLPLMPIASFAFAMLGGSDKDKDLKRTLRHAIGNDILARMLLDGPLTFAGIDMQQKLGDDNIFDPLPYTQWSKTFSDPDQFRKTVSAVLGPGVSQLEKTAKGFQLIGKGQYAMGMEQIVPKGLASGIQSFQYANKGYQMSNGAVLVDPKDIGNFALALNAVGLPTAQIKDLQWFRAQHYEIKQFYKNRTAEIEQAYIDAKKEDDTKKLEKLREEWRALQDGKDEVRWLFNDNPQELKKQPISALIRRPTSAERSEVKGKASTPAYNGIL